MSQGHDAVLRGGYKETLMRRDLRKMLGKQTTGAAAAGILADSGSVADARLSSMDAAENDININEMNAQRERWGFQVQATNYMNQASAARASGRNAMTAGVIGAGTTLLSLVTPKIDEWMGGNAAGADGLYTQNSNTGLNNAYNTTDKLFYTAADIHPNKGGWGRFTPYADSIDPSSFGLDASSFGAGLEGFSGGKLKDMFNTHIPGYLASYGQKYSVWPR